MATITLTTTKAFKFDADWPVHYVNGIFDPLCLCGKYALQATTDPDNVTCEQCKKLQDTKGEK